MIRLYFFRCLIDSGWDGLNRAAHSNWRERIDKSAPSSREKSMIESAGKEFNRVRLCV